MSEEKKDKAHWIKTEQGGYIKGTPAGGEVARGRRAEEVWVLCEPGPAVSTENLCDCAWEIQTPIIAADAVETTIDVRCPTHDRYGLRVRVRLPGAIAVNAELLEACKAFVHFAELPGDKVPRDEYIVYQVNALGEAKAAIAKAEGRER